MYTLLVTGGAGFIGSHISEALLKEGNKVIIVDSFNEFYSADVKQRNVQEIEDACRRNKIPDEHLTIKRGDIRDKALIDEIFSNYNIDCVIHLAAYAGVRPSIENPELYYDVNVSGTLFLLEAMRKYNVGRMVFASSSSVYGNNRKIPFSESDTVDNPISPYAATKKAGELLCYTYSHLYNIKTACLRFFTVYGPRQRPDLAIYKFTKLILENQEIPFFGDGNTRRDYTYIDDIADGVLKAVKWTSQADNEYDIFNLGENHTISLSEMVHTIEEVLGRPARLKMLPKQAGDVEITNADINKARTILNYNPKTKFEEGIQKFIDWYINNKGVEKNDW